MVEKLLIEINIGPFLVKLVASFLSNRSQVVKYQIHYSNSLPVYNGDRFLDRWKFVDDLTVVETCYQSLVRNTMSILSDVADDTAILDMRVNPSKSMIMPISFLKTSPLFLNPIPPDISLSSFKLLGASVSSNLKWDIPVKDNVHKANASTFLLMFLNKFNAPPHPILYGSILPLSAHILNMHALFGILVSPMMNHEKLNPIRKQPQEWF